MAPFLNRCAAGSFPFTLDKCPQLLDTFTTLAPTKLGVIILLEHDISNNKTFSTKL